MAYTCVTLGPNSDNLAARFVATWQEYGPGVPTDFLVICNGGPLRLELALIFAPLNPTFFPRENDAGKDVSGFMSAAAGPCAKYDSVLWCGESIFFHREGWLRRLVEAWQRHGPGLFGPFSSNNVRAHLQTSAFFCSPKTLLSYPLRPTSNGQRFEWEHGPRSMWRRLAERGVPVRLVTFDGEWPPMLWRMPMNIIGRGTQENLLMLNNHALAWAEASPLTRHQWSVQYDRPFA